MNSYISSMKFLINLTNDEAKDHPVKMTVGDLKQFFTYIEELKQKVISLENELDNVNQTFR